MLQANAGRQPLPDPRARQTDLASPLAGRRMLSAGLMPGTVLVLVVPLARGLAANGLDGVDMVLLEALAWRHTTGGLKIFL
jgi:hypothetical protein